MKVNKKLVIAAGICMLCGSVIAGTAFVIMARSSESNMRMQTMEITEDISNINISVDMSDIKIIAKDTDKLILTYFTDDTNKYDISADNGTLSVEYNGLKKEKAKWYDYYLSFDFIGDRDVILEVPRNFNAEVQLNSGYGDIEVMDISGGSIKAHTAYGDLEISHCMFDSVECSTDYGDIDIERCDGDILNCSTDYGDIEMERLSGKNIIMDTACGDIEGTIVGNESDYTITASTNIGDKNIKDRTGGENTLDLKTDAGEIDIEFVR